MDVVTIKEIILHLTKAANLLDVKEEHEKADVLTNMANYFVSLYRRELYNRKTELGYGQPTPEELLKIKDKNKGNKQEEKLLRKEKGWESRRNNHYIENSRMNG